MFSPADKQVYFVFKDGKIQGVLLTSIMPGTIQHVVEDYKYTLKIKEKLKEEELKDINGYAISGYLMATYDQNARYYDINDCREVII